MQQRLGLAQQQTQTLSGVAGHVGDSPAVATGGLLVGEDTHGPLTGGLPMAGGADPVLGAGSVEVIGHHRMPRRVERHPLLVDLGDLEVQLGAPSSGNRLEHDLADEVVREPHLPCRGRLEDTDLGRRVHNALGLTLLDPDDAAGVVERGAAPEQRETPQHGKVRLGHAGQSALDHLLHTLGHSRGSKIRASRHREEPRELQGEQWVASRAVEHRARQRQEIGGAGHTGDQGDHGVLIQPSQGQHRAVPSQELLRLRRRLIRAHRAHEQATGRPQARGQEPEQSDRRQVGPMQVIDHDHDRGDLTHPVHDVGHGLELRKARRLGAVVTYRSGALERPGIAHQPAQNARPRPERRHTVAMPAGGPSNGHPVGGRLRRDLLGQPGLADARLAREQNSAAAASDGVSEPLTEQRQMAVAPNQRCEDGGHQRAVSHGRGIAVLSAASATERRLCAAPPGLQLQQNVRP